jgi:REP element-mobilizing transposase RayT
MKGRLNLLSRKEPSETGLDGFQPIDPWKSEDLVFKRRNLPHLEVPGATYFVTFRCGPKLELPPEARDLAFAAIQACDRKTIDLDAAVVMPDHAHVIFRLMNGYKLSHVIQRIKGRSARRIKQMLNSEGSIWMDESFDHIIRDAAELEEKIEYVRQNPLRKGLADRLHHYRWLYVRNITG